MTRRRWAADDLADLLVNPIAAGIGPYPRIVDDEIWIIAAKRGIQEHGADQFFRRLLRVLRQSFPEPDELDDADATSPEARS